MENVMENIAYVDYSECVQIDLDKLIVSAWNTYLEYKKRGENKIFLNNKEFFENSFDNAYDAAWAVSLSNKWRWTDDYVCFGDDGYLTSFNHWDDENSPIDIDKIDLNHLIDGLARCQKNDKKGYVNNIPKAIHEALQEV